jgi:hypothetical protein
VSGWTPYVGAAHTGRTRLVCADTPEDLVRAVTRAQGPVRSDVPADQAWFWDHEWQRGEREASEQIAAGQTEEFEDAESMFDALEDKER